MLKLSILVMTVPSRIRTFMPNLLEKLDQQVEAHSSPADIEILCLYDNKRRSVGTKRNGILHLAAGEYIAYIDDDDDISSDYISSIMEVLDSNKPDCIVFDCLCTVDDKIKRNCKYSIAYPQNYLKSETEWRGKPAHTMVWKREIAGRHAFPDLKTGEDFGWVEKAWPDIKDEIRIPKVLYYYNFNSATSETRN